MQSTTEAQTVSWVRKPHPWTTQRNYFPGLIVFIFHVSAVDTTHSFYRTNIDSTTRMTTPTTSARPPHTQSNPLWKTAWSWLHERKSTTFLDVRDLWVALGRSIGCLHSAGQFEQN